MRGTSAGIPRAAAGRTAADRIREHREVEPCRGDVSAVRRSGSTRSPTSNDIGVAVRELQARSAKKSLTNTGHGNL